ncbi:hypothetical protein UlMin_034640 [Ulmus minor]
MDMLNVCAHRTYEWGFKKYGRIRNEIGRIQRELEARKTYFSYGVYLKEFVEMEKKLDVLQNQDKIYWKQRSRMDWLAHGDRNSKVFHLKAYERKRKNRIVGLLNRHEEWCSNSFDILSIISNYFQNIFSSSSPSTFDLDEIFSCSISSK